MRPLATGAPPGVPPLFPQVIPRWHTATDPERARGHLGSLTIALELEQPQAVTVTLQALSIHNATLGSMPKKGPIQIAGRGGRLRANLVIEVEGGAQVATDPLAVPEHVRAGGAGLYLTLDRLQLEDAGFELEPTSRRQWDALLAGSGGLLRALRFVSSSAPLVALVYPQAKALYEGVASLWSRARGTSDAVEPPAAPAASLAEGIASLWSRARGTSDAVEPPAAPAASPAQAESTRQLGAGEGRGGTRLVDDVLRLIGQVQCEGNQHKPLLTWSTLDQESPELTRYLAAIYHRQQLRDLERHVKQQQMRREMEPSADGISPLRPTAVRRARSWIFGESSPDARPAAKSDAHIPQPSPAVRRTQSMRSESM